MRKFSSPLTILVGLGFPMQISELMEAWRMLNEWPVSHRGELHAGATDACRAAFSDAIKTDDAQAAFAALAAAAGILVDDPMPLAAERVAEEWLGNA